ncbi:MAG: hypothetical protein ABJ242_03420 [Marinomonas sp.]
MTWVDQKQGSAKRALQGFNRDALFAVSMMVATGFGFAKAILLAALLPVEIYGFYIAAFGIATLSGMVLSLGEIERTYKVYPKLDALGNGAAILGRAFALVRRLALRLLVCLAGVSALFEFYSPYGMGLAEVVTVMGVAMLFMCQTLMASVIRAIDSLRILPRFTAARGLVALVVTTPVAIMTQDWILVLQIEAFGIALVLLLFVLLVSAHPKVATEKGEDVKPEELDDSETRSGRLIYSASLISALVPYGGRSALLAIDGPAMAGAFGVLNALVQVAQLLASSLAQKLAPDLLKEAALRGDGARVGWLERFGVSLVLLWGTSIAVFLGTAISFFWSEAFEFWAGYTITIPVLFITAIQMAMSAHLFLFFAVVSEDREKDLVFAAIATVFIFYTGLKAASFFSIGLPGYAASAALASTAHTLYLAACYRRALRANA